MRPQVCANVVWSLPQLVAPRSHQQFRGACAAELQALEVSMVCRLSTFPGPAMETLVCYGRCHSMYACMSWCMAYSGCCDIRQMCLVPSHATRHFGAYRPCYTIAPKMVRCLLAAGLGEAVLDNASSGPVTPHIQGCYTSSLECNPHADWKCCKAAHLQ